MTEKIFPVINYTNIDRKTRGKRLCSAVPGGKKGGVFLAETLKASTQIVNEYLGLFANRRAYTMQSVRPHPESGRHYYFRPTKKNSHSPLALTKETI